MLRHGGDSLFMLRHGGERHGGDGGGAKGPVPGGEACMR
jgi:hypothetical protein